MLRRSWRWLAAALIALIVVLANWPRWQKISPGLDSSWQAGTALAFTHHLQWGSALDFPYDLYGFAGFVQPLYRSTALIGGTYVLAVSWALAGLLIAGCSSLLPPRGRSSQAFQGSGGAAGTTPSSGRRFTRGRWVKLPESSITWLSLAAGGILSWGVLAVSWAESRTADFASVAGLALAFAVLFAPEDGSVLVATIGLSTLAGFTILVKVETGLLLVSMLVLCLVGRPPGPARRATAISSGFAAFSIFVIAWEAGGQGLGHLGQFAQASIALFSGYSAAMGGNLPGPHIAWWALVATVALAAMFAGALAGRPRRAQLAGSLMAVGWGWAIVKDGFVSGNHFPGFFRVTLAAGAVAWLYSKRKLVFAVPMGLLAAALLFAGGLPHVDPAASVRSAARQAWQTVFRPSHFQAVVVQERSDVLAKEGISQRVVALLRGHSVAVEPWQDIIAWALPSIRWDPEPVLQSYSAYTTRLDTLDAAFLSSPRAPQVILYRMVGFDQRYPVFDPPATMDALYCHYSERAVSGPWQVLQRVTDRCGRPVSAGLTEASFGQSVAVPDARGEMLVASFSFSTPFLDELKGMALKPSATYVTLWERSGRAVRYRLVPGTAGDVHVISTPPSLGYSPRFRPLQVARLQLSGNGWDSGQGRIVVRWALVTVKAGPRLRS